MNAQENRIRAWKIFRLRGMYSSVLALELPKERADDLLILIDKSIVDLSAESEIIRRMKRTAQG